MPIDAGCETSRRGGWRLAVGRAAVVALLAIVMASTQGCGVGIPNLGQEFGGMFLKAYRCAKDTFNGFLDEINSGKEVWEERKELRNSDTNLFPDVQLVAEQGILEFCGDALVGTISYNGISLPDLGQIELYVGYTQDEDSFFLDFQADVFARLGDFELKAGKLTNLNGANVHDKYHDVAVEVNNFALATETAMWTQGHNNWQSDDFAGQLIGHTLLASLLERTENANEWILDFLGTESALEPVQVKKQQILAMMPLTLLKSRATFTAGPAGPTLVKIEVQNQLEGGSSSGVQWEILRDEALMEFTSGSGVRWEIAKKVFFSGALYVLESYHTGIHLYQASVVAAIRNSVPAGSMLGESVKPQTQQALLTLLEQVAALHADHGAAFTGGIWPTADHNLVWNTTRDIARYYADYSPDQFLGDQESDKPDWWAGMSSIFVEPIAKFANAIATEVFNEGLSENWLGDLQSKLEQGGLVVKPQSPVDVTTVEGLGMFLTNMIFVPSIVHSHMYAAREAFTPLFFVSTQEFLVYLEAPDYPGNMQQILETAYPTIDPQFHQNFFLMYGTSSGFAPQLDKTAPQLGDGPYYGPFGIILETALSEFQGELAAARADVMVKFGDIVEGNGKWLPGYFYPKGAVVPFGFGITSTTYI